MTCNSSKIRSRFILDVMTSGEMFKNFAIFLEI